MNSEHFYSTPIGSSNEQMIGRTQLEILLSVKHLGEAAYGANIKRATEKRVGKEMHTPQVYAALMRLELLGYVSSQSDELSSAGQRGRVRRTYKIEAPGRQMLKSFCDLSSTVLERLDNLARPEFEKVSTT